MILERYESCPIICRLRKILVYFKSEVDTLRNKEVRVNNIHFLWKIKYISFLGNDLGLFPFSFSLGDLLLSNLFPLCFVFFMSCSSFSICLGMGIFTHPFKCFRFVNVVRVCFLWTVLSPWLILSSLFYYDENIFEVWSIYLMT